ncbi:MAG: chemotaxis protein CheW [Candidatus Sedimenticola endophacoides]
MSAQVSVGEIRGVLLPIHSGQLLLPNASVAEVTGYQQPSPPGDDFPGWLLGGFPWRQQTVPLISFDHLIGAGEADAGLRARVAICNTTSSGGTHPHFALLLRSIPHLVRISEENVSALDDAEPGHAMVAQRVRLNGEEAMIPDLDALEAALPPYRIQGG